MSIPPILVALNSFTFEDLIYVAAKVEFYVIGVAILAAILILSIAAATFIVKTALDHAFPAWRTFFRERTST